MYTTYPHYQNYDFNLNWAHFVIERTSERAHILTYSPIRTPNKQCDTEKKAFARLVLLSLCLKFSTLKYNCTGRVNVNNVIIVRQKREFFFSFSFDSRATYVLLSAFSTCTVDSAFISFAVTFTSHGSIWLGKMHFGCKPIGCFSWFRSSFHACDFSSSFYSFSLCAVVLLVFNHFTHSH